LIYFITITMSVTPNLIGPLFAVAGVTALIATPGWVVIGGRIGKKRAYARAMMINMVVMLAVFFLPPSLAMLLFGIYVINGAADAGNQLMPNAMVPDTVEVDELHNGVRREGAIFGAWAFCRKVGMAGGAFLASVCLSLFGFVSGSAEQVSTAHLGIRIAFSLLPLVLWLGAFKWLSRYELDEESFNEIKSRLGRRSDPQ
jgi:GPH family glycoside/pentoside/hexuronide:cation symporter